MITTVIPTYKRPEMLKRAIESALAQNVEDLKVCVYDNFSKDGTKEMVLEYCRQDSRVVYVERPENIGAAKNIEYALRAVDTEYYTLLSDDDFLLPGFYEQALKKFEEYPIAAFVCAKTLAVDLINKRVEYRNKGWGSGLVNPGIDISRKMYSSHFVTTSVMFRRSVMDALGPFDPSGSDLMYMTMASAIYPFVVLDQYGAAVMLHEQAYSMQGDGMVKEQIVKLYDSYLKNSEVILRSGLPVAEQFGLMMMYLSFYQNIFDSKRLYHVLGAEPEPLMTDLLALPSLISNRGLVVKAYNAVPGFLKPMVRFLYKKINSFNRRKERAVSGAWAELPEGAFDLLRHYDPDVSKLKFKG
ncbi:glycosyltransferase family 2 protein [Pseudomonas sp. MWU13-2105]|uniref:glycosyltransferase family 2 protein n=1 Tax=Pseudomonas sp. MWU13-2105 TaxID=2935074 RepID=UPI00200FFA28|nr:glycosyltransferase family 2 protein [Pseudomonas sp. MWU13-2105]